MSRKISISVAPNGARMTKLDHPALPLGVDEIAKTARACFEAGADMIHLHIRDENGLHSLDAGRYHETMAAIGQSAPALEIQITTEAAGIYDVVSQYNCLRHVNPKYASVSVHEMTRDPSMATMLYAFADEAGVTLQHICYDASDLEQLMAWQRAGMLSKTSNSVLFVLGKYSPVTFAVPADLDAFLQSVTGQELDWSVCAFGPNEAACLFHAMKLGGNIRTGFENNINLPSGKIAADNAELVSLATKACHSLGLHPRNQPEPVL